MRQLQGRVPSPRYVALAGAAVLVVGCLLPWASYSGFPGKMSLSFVLGGARLHVILLALIALFLVRPRTGSWRAARRASICALIDVLLTIVFIGYAAGGLVNVSPGAWVALVGALVFAVAAQSVDDPGTAKPVALPAVPLKGVLERLIVVGVAGLGLLVFVVGLGIATSGIADGPDTKLLGAVSMNDLTNEGEFLSFLLLVTGAALGLGAVGVQSGITQLTHKYQRWLIAAAIAAAVLFPFTQDGNGYSLRIASSIGVFAAAAVGLNIVVGLAGLLDLGYIAFFGVGAYFAALVSGSASSVWGVHLPFLLVVFLGALVSGAFGVLLGAPTLRLRGDYLAIVTLGFGEIFRISANNLDGSAGPSLTNGPNGISDIPDLELGSFNFGDQHELFGITLPFQANYFWLEIILVCVVLVMFLRLSESRIGRAWVAIREDELAAAATGINTTRLKLLAFALGAMLAGAAGSVDAHVLKVTEPNSFTFIESATLLAAVILGGMGTVPGALLGATVLYLLPEKLRFLQDLRLLFFGVALVLIMRFRPEGLIASRRRAREFHDEDSGADSLGGPVTGESMV
jgi:branched-chain amino acid transport system permease protein